MTAPLFHTVRRVPAPENDTFEVFARQSRDSQSEFLAPIDRDIKELRCWSDFVIVLIGVGFLVAYAVGVLG